MMRLAGAAAAAAPAPGGGGAPAAGLALRRGDKVRDDGVG